MKRMAVVTFAMLNIAGLAWAATEPSGPISVTINDMKGKQIAAVSLTQENDGVRFKLNVTDLNPGTYAVHVHDHGVCAPPDFKSAGDHFNPEKKKHGKVEGGSHAGDLPNVVVKADRTGEFSELNNHVTLTDGPNSLFKKGGTAIIIHAKADDYSSQPAGAAGDRIGCGLVKTPDNIKKMKK